MVPRSPFWLSSTGIPAIVESTVSQNQSWSFWGLTISQPATILSCGSSFIWDSIASKKYTRKLQCSIPKKWSRKEIKMKATKAKSTLRQKRKLWISSSNLQKFFSHRHSMNSQLKRAFMLYIRKESHETTPWIKSKLSWQRAKLRVKFNLLMDFARSEPKFQSKKVKLYANQKPIYSMRRKLFQRILGTKYKAFRGRMRRKSNIIGQKTEKQCNLSTLEMTQTRTCLTNWFKIMNRIQVFSASFEHKMSSSTFRLSSWAENSKLWSDQFNILISYLLSFI